MLLQQLNIFAPPAAYPPEAGAALHSWGIAETVAHHLGWVYSAGKFTYPTGQGTRQRVLLVAGKTAGMKNFWEPGDLPMPPLYPPDFAPDHHGVLYLTNGEKSTLAHISAGLPNSANTFGEGSRMADALLLMKARGVRKIIHAPDCDSKGLITALQWHEQAATYGIEVDLRDLRRYFQHTYQLAPAEYQTINYRNGLKWTSNGWDTRDLLLLVEKDAELYRAILHRLPPLIAAFYEDELPRPKALIQHQHRSYRRQRFAQINWQQAWDEWEADVRAALDRAYPIVKGKQWRHCANPHHADQHPSARITERGVYVCVCGSHNYHALAGWLNYETWAERKRHLLRECPPLPEHKPAPRPFTPPSGFWHSLITAIFQAADKHNRQWRNNLAGCLRLAEILFRAGAQSGEKMPIRKVLAVAEQAGFTRRIFYRMIERQSGLCHLGKTYKLGFLKESACEAGTVCLPNPLALARWLGVSIYGAVPLPDAALESNTAYLDYVLLGVFHERGVGTTAQESKAIPLQALANASGGSISAVSRAKQRLKAAGLLDWERGEKWRDMSYSELIAEWEKIAARLRGAGTTGYIKMFYTASDGGWLPLIHAGGRRKKPSNNIPLTPGALHYWLHYAANPDHGLIQHNPITGEEVMNLTFVLVTRTADRYFMPVNVFRQGGSGYNGRL